MQDLRDVVLSWYPDLHSKTYCVPPVYFNRVLYEKVTVAGQPAYVTVQPSSSSSQIPKQQAMSPSDAASQKGHGKGTKRPSLASSKSAVSQKLFKAAEKSCEEAPTTYSMWTREPAQPETSKTPPVYPSDLRDDFAQQHVLHNLQKLSDDQQDARFILSQLNFTDYLNKPAYAAAAAQLPRPIHLPQSHQRGDFDVLIMDRQYGILLAEIKSVGLREKELNKTQGEADKDLVKRVERAMKQLDKSKDVVKHLVSDLDPDLAIHKTLMLPYITASQLDRVLADNPGLEQALCKCLGVPDRVSAVQQCLTSDKMSDVNTPWEVPRSVLDQLNTWWKYCMGDTPDPHLTPDIYLDLIARFCGPATSVNIHFVLPPRVEVRIMWEAVSVTGERLACLLLTPEQLDLLNRAPDMVLLAGPPGTGKSVLLVLIGLVWLRLGHDVHVLSTNHASLVMSRLIHHQLVMTLQEDPAAASATEGTVGSVHFHDFDLLNCPEDVEAAVNALVTANAGKGPLCVLMDEIFLADRRMAPLYQQLVETLTSRVSRLCLWAATMRSVNVPKGLEVESVTVPLRSAPVVVREVSKGVGLAKGLVPGYAGSGTASPCDGPDVIRLRHQGDGHVGKWPVDCLKCGQDVAEELARLNVGQTTDTTQASSIQSPPPLHYHDVFVLTRSSELQDDVIDDAGQVTSPASGVVRGLRAANIPVCVMGSVVTIDDEVKWRDNADDIAVARSDRVIVGDYRAVVGLERKIVVYLPGRWQGVDDQRSAAAIDAMDRVFAMSRCTALLIVVEVPGDDPVPLARSGVDTATPAMSDGSLPTPANAGSTPCRHSTSADVPSIASHPGEIPVTVSSSCGVSKHDDNSTTPAELGDVRRRDKVSESGDVPTTVSDSDDSRATVSGSGDICTTMSRSGDTPLPFPQSANVSSPQSGPASTKGNVTKSQTSGRPSAGQWPIIFTRDDL